MSKQKKLIEMVCTGNNGRSPVAELLARNHLVTIGAESDFEIASSGIMVNYTDRFLAGEAKGDIYMTRAILKAAKDSGLIAHTQYQEIQATLRQGDEDRLFQYAVEIAPKLMAAERTHMREVLDEMGIRGDIKQGRDQTVVKSNALVVLAMDKEGLESVNAIYAPTPYRPTTAVLPVYAIGEDREVVNAFGGKREDYFITVKQLAREVPLAVNKAVGA